MEPPDGDLTARPVNQTAPPTVATISTVRNQSNHSYANVISVTPNINSAPNRPPVLARTSTHNGMPAVIFKAKDYYGVMAEECKYLIVGRFIRVRPQIEKIRSTFAEKIPLKGNPKIGVYDLHNIFIELYNKEDYNTVRFRRRIEVDGKEMWLTKWTPDWKPEEDASYAPVWVLLPKLPMNCHKWDYIKQILAPVGIPLAIDTATRGRTRPSMAKVRVEIDLLKPQLEQVWVGLEDDNTGLKGFAQKNEYEAVPKYCKHCRLLGHSIVQCRFLEKKKQAETNKVTEEYSS